VRETRSSGTNNRVLLNSDKPAAIVNDAASSPNLIVGKPVCRTSVPAGLCGS
jgi:hypothetical protein